MGGIISECPGDFIGIGTFHEAVGTKFIEKGRNGCSRGRDQYAEAIDATRLLCVDSVRPLDRRTT